MRAKLLSRGLILFFVGTAWGIKTPDICTGPTSIGWQPRNIPLGSINSFWSEDFEEGILPSGWTVTDGNGDGLTWYVNEVLNSGDLLGNTPPYPGEYILYYSDDDAGAGSPGTVETATVTVTLPEGLTGLFLSFCWGLSVYTNEGIEVDVEGNNVWSMWSDGSGLDVVDISNYVGFTTITLDFRYDDGGGNWGWAGAFDNISLSPEPPPPPPGMCCVFEECGPLPADLYLADMAYDNTRGLIYQVENDMNGSDILIWDPYDCSYCEAPDYTTGIHQKGIAYNPLEDVIYVGGWCFGNYPAGTVFTFDVPQCDQPLELISACTIEGTDLQWIAGLAWDDDFGGLFVQPNSMANLLGKIDPSTCSILWECAEEFYWGGDGYDAAGLAYSPEDHGLYALSEYDNSINFFINPEVDDCVADTFCLLEAPVTFGWGVGQIDGIPGEFWVSDITGFMDYHGECILPPVGILEKREREAPNLLLVHPNPFANFTEITFHLPLSGAVTLSIYNASGQLIETLLNTTMSSGRHTTVWNAKNTPSGIYFIKLERDNLNVTRKLVLMR